MHINVNQYQRFELASRVQKKRQKQVSQETGITPKSSTKAVLKRDYVILEGSEDDMSEQLENLAARITKGRNPVGYFVDIRI